MKPPLVIRIPGDGAVCPAIIRSGSDTTRSELNVILPETSNTHTRGVARATHARRVPEPESASEVTFTTLYCLTSTDAAVGVTAGVAVTLGEGVAEAVGARVLVAVAGIVVGVLVRVGTGVDIAITRGVLVAVGIIGTDVLVAVGVEVRVAVGVEVCVAVAVGGNGVGDATAPLGAESLVNENI